MAWRKCLGGVALAIVVGAGLPLVTAAPAAAASITVTTTADVVDAGDGVTSLREALSSASAMAGADDVILGVGQIYQLTICDGGPGQEDANGAGDLDHSGTGALTITGNGSTIEQTCADENERVLHHRGGGILTLVDVAVTGGEADEEGGGVYSQGSVVLDGSSVVDNRAGTLSLDSGLGGGMLVDGSLTMIDSEVSNNRAVGSFGEFGGVRVYGDVSMVDSHIDGNEASDYGIVGAYDVPGAFDSTITMLRSTIDGNTAKGLTVGAGGLDMTESSVSGNCCGRGGDVTVDTLTMVDSVMSDNELGFPALVTALDIHVSDSTFEGNAGTGGLLWGALWDFDDPISIVVEDSVIQGNHLDGWAVYGSDEYDATTIDVTVRDSLVVDNTATPTTPWSGRYSSSGVRSDGSLTIEGSVVASNSSSGSQPDAFAGVWAEGVLTLTDSVVRDNAAPNGLGAGVRGGSVVVSGSTVAGNVTSSSVGSEAGVVSEGLIDVANSTVTGNHAESAGVVGGDVVLDQVTVAGNVGSVVGGVGGDSLGATASALGDAGGAPVCVVPQGSVVSGGFNVVSDGSCSLLAATDDVMVGSLLLGALGNNGGPTPTLLPTPGSPVVGVVPVGDALCAGTDQRGVVRPKGSGCEAGSVEVADLDGFLVDTTADTLDVVPGDGVCADAGAACSLRAAIQESNVLVGADRVLLPAGSYGLSRVGFDDLGGDVDVRGDLELVGLGAAPGDTVVDGAGLDRVVHVQGAGVDLVLENASVSGGLTAGVGGGVLGDSSTSIVLTDTVVAGNQALVAGGVFGWGAVTVTDSVVSGNDATNLGGVGSFGVLEISGSVIEGNVASANFGGVVAGGTGPAVVSDSVISGNTAGGTGGAGGLATVVVTSVENSTVLGNVSSGLAGGIYAEGGAVLDIVGSTIEANTAVSHGGGVFVNGASLELDGSQVTGNQGDIGGGVAVINGDTSIAGSMIDQNTANQVGGVGAIAGTLEVSDTTISANEALDGGGGGLLVNGTVLDLDTSRVTANQAHVGGGVASINGVVSITGSTIDHNTAGQVGGVGAIAGTLEVSDTTISANEALDGGGGGLLVNGTVLDLDTSRVTANQAHVGGGVASINGVVSITGSTIDHNTAGQVGGLGAIGGSLVVANTTISANQASQVGGGVFHVAHTTLDSVTITDNTTGASGAGLYVLGNGELGPGYVASTTVANSIIAGQAAGGDCGGTGAVVSNGYNLESGTSCGFTATGDLANTAPLLGVLGDNGGVTPAHLPQPGSPAIDNGTTTLTTDQRGQPRPTGTNDDIGAVET